MCVCNTEHRKSQAFRPWCDTNDIPVAPVACNCNLPAFHCKQLSRVSAACTGHSVAEMHRSGGDLAANCCFKDTRGVYKCPAWWCNIDQQGLAGASDLVLCYHRHQAIRSCHRAVGFKGLSRAIYSNPLH